MTKQTLEDFRRLPFAGKVHSDDKVIDSPYKHHPQQVMINHQFSQDLVQYDLQAYRRDPNHVVVTFHEYQYQSGNEKFVAHVPSNTDPVHPDDHTAQRNELKKQAKTICKSAPESRTGNSYPLTVKDWNDFIQNQKNLFAGAVPHEVNLRAAFKQKYNIT